ncbi:MAG TPA: 2-succinyl-5-enolpyruvyl-6-hydroxy-3-cyclohexene-1-carboxylic-acid synthase, partial [Chroococcidiopsis sp.]
MSIDFSNTNSVWASILVETLHRLGVTTAIACPGSRSTPLTVAVARHPKLEAIPILDERSAAFFALGVAQRSRQPTLLICTSGTAGANFYPAVIEARERRIPLLVLTADRPPELRECNAGQTIDQQKLYGTFPNWYSELSVPSLARSQLAYLRQTVIHAWERSLYPVAGPVHLNLPFRDPLPPIPQADAQALAVEWDDADFFGWLTASLEQRDPKFALSGSEAISPPWSPIQPWSHWQTERGIIIAGVAQPSDPQRYCEAIAQLSQRFGFPVLAEGLSPVRNYGALNPHLISAYEFILRQPELARQLTPTVVIRIGDMPTSKTLRDWLAQSNAQQWVIDPSDRNLDPLHGRTHHWRIAIEQLAEHLMQSSPQPSNATKGTAAPTETAYLKSWRDAEANVWRSLDSTLAQTDALFEGKIAWLLSQTLPPQTPVFIANSMPVRDVEWFWKVGDRALQPFFNRGANGIDGTLSTALGVAHRHRSTVLLTGDLALLHDTNGLLLRHKLEGHLTIVLVNNNGGGIFGMLAIAQFEPPFEEFFATPQHVNFAALCAAYGIEYEQIT